MGALERNHFLLRKLHSLTGLLPVGLFLIEHFITNYQSVHGAQQFNEAAAFIDTIPFIRLLELLIIIPLFYHAFFGIWVALLAKNTLPRYNYPRNWAFYLQRWTGFLTLAFVIFHLWEFRWAKLMGEVGYGQKLTVTYDWVASHMNNNLLFAFYIVAIVGTCYHFANGMWEFCIDWGFTIGPKAQRISLAVWSVFFIALSALGIGAAAGFRMHPVGAVGQAPAPATLTLTAPAAGTP